MVTAGFDIGTRVIKVCIVKERSIAGWAKSELDDSIESVIKNTYRSALDNAGIKKDRVGKKLATGYCSEMVRGRIRSVSEAFCIARAVCHYNYDVRCVVDIGGLFINIITIDDKGHLSCSASNDRCAAGSGKFLEMVSEATGIPLDSISAQVMMAAKPCSIKSNCAVFAESEVISRINAGHNAHDIMASVLFSIASRTATLLEKTSSPDAVALIGGVSRIYALRSILEELVGRKIAELPSDPQIVSAYGAGLIAQDN